MNPLGFLFIGIGAIAAIAGVFLFSKMGTQGTSTIKMLGFEFQLGGSALVIFVLGVLLIMLPVLFADRFFDRRIQADPPATSSAPSGARLPFVIQAQAGQVEFKGGEFGTLSQCLDKVTASGDQLRECISLPERVWCSNVSLSVAAEWECFVDKEQCERTAELDEIVLETKPRVRCAPMSVGEARRRSLAP